MPNGKGLQMGVKCDLIKVATKVAEVASVDEQCNPTNPLTDRRSVGFYIDIFCGPQAWMDIFGYFVSTDWVAGNGNWRQGLQFVWHAFKHCRYYGDKANTWGPDEILNTGFKYTFNYVMNAPTYAMNAMLDAMGHRKKAKWSEVQKQQQPSEPMKTPDAAALYNYVE